MKKEKTQQIANN